MAPYWMFEWILNNPLAYDFFIEFRVANIILYFFCHFDHTAPFFLAPVLH